MKRLLVTGGAGFIGSNFIRHLLLDKKEDVHIVNVDALTYAGNLANLTELEALDCYNFVKADICDKEAMGNLFEQHNFDGVINFAAESHVDRSILDSGAFVRTNIEGTRVLLDLALKYKTARFLQVSTDEVYGSLGNEGAFEESMPLIPNSPYSASKAGADLLVRAYNKTYGLPTLITRCSNNYGPYQFPEKFIPLCITNVMANTLIPVYGDGKNVRDWIYVSDHCEAVWQVFKKGELGEVYNIGAEHTLSNIEMVKILLKAFGKDESLITYVKDRPGHDFRYAMNNTKISTALGWKPAVSFEEGIQKTVAWYKQNKEWWQDIKSGAYEAYYQKQYEGAV